MNIEAKFESGQEVWPVFLTGDASTPRCMHCGHLPFPGQWNVTGKSRTVYRIHIERVGPFEDCPDPVQQTIIYEFWRGGRLYPEEDVFGTLEEAEAEAVRRNAALKETK